MSQEHPHDSASPRPQAPAQATEILTLPPFDQAHGMLGVLLELIVLDDLARPRPAGRSLGRVAERPVRILGPADQFIVMS